MERRLPAEWERQSFVLLAWPHPEGDFAPWIEEVSECYTDLVLAIAESLPVLIACRDLEHWEWLKRFLKRALRSPGRRRVFREPVFGIELPFRDSWVRDTAPIPLLTPQGPHLIKFRFNGWGGRYPSGEDDRFGVELWRRGVFGPVPLSRTGWVVEGGSLESDGEGRLLTTESALLNPNRNRNPLRLRKALSELLRIERWFLLKGREIPGDDTDGHIDLLARFAPGKTVVHLEGLEGELRKRFGRGHRLIAVPLPDLPLPASYCNFLLLNGTLLLPQYGVPEDKIARAQIGKAFPGWRVVPLDATPLIRQYGSLHCATFAYPEPFRLHVEPCLKL